MKNVKFIYVLLAGLSLGCGEIKAPELSPAEQDAAPGNGFPDPVIDEISPARGSPLGGTVLTITGSDFAEGTTVIIGSRVAEETTVVSDTELSVVTPPSDLVEEAVDVLVFNATGSTRVPAAFTFNRGPTLDTVSPSIVALGGSTEIVLTGSGFQENNSDVQVLLGGVPALEVEVVSDTEIRTRAPQQGPEKLAETANVRVVSANGTAELAEGPMYLRPGLLMGSSRDDSQFGVFYIDPPTQTFARIVSLASNVSKMARHPQGGFVLRFGNRGQSPLGNQAIGHLDLETRAIDFLGKSKLQGGQSSLRISDMATIGGQIIALHRNSEFGSLDLATLELTDIAAITHSRSTCVAPGATPGTAIVIVDFSTAIKTVNLATGVVTDTVIPSGDILPGTQVFCHGADVLNGTLFAIMMDQSLGQADLVSIALSTGAVTKVADLPIFASGLVAMPPF